MTLHNILDKTIDLEPLIMVSEIIVNDSNLIAYNHSHLKFELIFQLHNDPIEIILFSKNIYEDDNDQFTRFVEKKEHEIQFKMTDKSWQTHSTFSAITRYFLSKTLWYKTINDAREELIKEWGKCKA